MATQPVGTCFAATHQVETATYGGCRRMEGATVFGIIGWILFGLIVGIVAKIVMPGRDPGGFVVTILIGIVGALLGGFIGRAMGLYGPDETAGFFMALLGAVILLALYRILARPRRI
jgi:uncharacterized membrane protein YeaQ/YmgE (transglycosylase-associated protein family)